MDALPPDNTPRYKVFYTVLGTQHDFQVRASAAVSPSTFGSAIDALLTQLDSCFYALTIDKVDFIATGSSVSNTVLTGIEGNTYGSGSAAGLLKPQFLAFQGRDSGGHKVRLSIYGVKFEQDDYRFNPGENADIDAAIVQLNASATIYWSIAGVPPLWYPYANTGFNAYWQRKARG